LQTKVLLALFGKRLDPVLQTKVLLALFGKRLSVSDARDLRGPMVAKNVASVPSKIATASRHRTHKIRASEPGGSRYELPASPEPSLPPSAPFRSPSAQADTHPLVRHLFRRQFRHARVTWSDQCPQASDSPSVPVAARVLPSEISGRKDTHPWVATPPAFQGTLSMMPRRVNAGA